MDMRGCGSPDLPLVALSGWLLWSWWPRGNPMPPLLRVLFLGFAWLPVAFSLYCAQSLLYAATGEFVLGRAPAHALFIGFFGSLLVAMVTRVTQGHSGRPLVLGPVAGFAFLVVQSSQWCVSWRRRCPTLWHGRQSRLQAG